MGPSLGWDAAMPLHQSLHKVKEEVKYHISKQNGRAVVQEGQNIITRADLATTPG